MGSVACIDETTAIIMGMLGGHSHATNRKEFFLMQMRLERHHREHFLFVAIVNIRVVRLPPSPSSLLAGELDSPELSRMLTKGQHG